jgi:hypothetical protein
VELADAGWHMDMNKHEVIMRNGAQVVKAKRQGRLYRIQSVSNPDVDGQTNCIRAEVKTVQEWHRCLGHMGVKSIMHTLQAAGIDVDKSDKDEQCKECIKGKICKLSNYLKPANKLPKSLWAASVLFAVIVINMVLMGKHQTATPYEMMYNQKPDYSKLHLFCSKYYLYNIDPKDKKYNARGIEGYMVGIDEHDRGYRVWLPNTRTIKRSKDVVFAKLNDTNIPNNNEQNNFPNKIEQNKFGRRSVTKKHVQQNENRVNPSVTNNNAGNNSAFPMKKIQMMMAALHKIFRIFNKTSKMAVLVS